MSDATGPDPAKREYPLPLPGHALPLKLWEQVERDAEAYRADDVSDKSETDFVEEDYNVDEEEG